MATTQQQPSTEVAQRTPMQELVASVRSPQFLEQVRNALPGNVTPERFVRVALTAIQQTPELVTADRGSLFGAIVRCAQDGLLPDGREAALTHRKDREKGRIAVYMPMIGGLRKIAAKHGITLVADVVREGDLFEWSKVPPKVQHVPARGEQRGEIVCAYAAAFDRDWRFVATPIVMDIPEIEKVRAVSSAATNGPWRDWWDRMACKTVARRLFKELPLGDLDENEARIVDAADADTAFAPTGMSADEANIAAGLTDARPPADKGPDDRAASADPGDGEQTGELVAEHDDEPAPVTPEQQKEKLELLVQLIDADADANWDNLAREYAAETFGGRPLDELTGQEFEVVLSYLRSQLPQPPRRGRA